jgi:hypothetical protein
MASSNSTIPTGAILNPYTPLAFLPPDVADQFQIICYVNVATLSVSLTIVRPLLFSPHPLTGTHMGLAHGDSGGVQNHP